MAAVAQGVVLADVASAGSAACGRSRRRSRSSCCPSIVIVGADDLGRPLARVLASFRRQALAVGSP
jgi:hypothetical protein